MKRIIILSASIFIIALTSCRKENNVEIDLSQNPIVSFKDKTLYKDELDRVIPLNVKAEDSISLAKTYIDTWLNDQLLYDKAQQNITRKAEIAELVENYKRTLITNIYREQLLQQELSQSIGENELIAYYEQNKEKFKLEENIIKGLFLKIPINSSQLQNFQKWYKQESSDAIENIEKNTLQNAVGYELFYDRWIDFDEIMDNIPAVIADRRNFLQTNKNLEAKDSSFVYLLNIKEYKLTGSEAPYKYIQGQLSEIFIEQRKSDFLKQLQHDLYEKAVKEEEIKFYNK